MTRNQVKGGALDDSRSSSVPTRPFSSLESVALAALPKRVAKGGISVYLSDCYFLV